MISIYPDHEENRLAALNSYNILDTANEKDFDDLTILASAICQTPMAFISLIDDKRQWFKSRKGISESETPIDISFCVHTIASDNDIMIVEDANKDERFAENPLVIGDDKITFYAGVPLINEDGFALGSLCVVDQKQKQLTDEQTVALKIIAKQVVDKLELRKKAIELELVNKELIKSNLFIQKFATMAAHDIRNPMSSILLTAQSMKLRMQKLGDTKCEELVDININSTKRLMALLDDMLAYSKAPALLLTQRETINLSELLMTVTGMISVPVNFNIQFPVEKYLLTVSAVALQQIFINLLTNAIRYNDKAQGHVNIRFSEDDKHYYFEIEDNGIGIAREYHEKIFNNNFTLNIADRYDKKGSGIGLSTVKEIIKSLQGKISVNSIIGQFTTFYISLPR
jgi:signal transduction histidine kinase